MTRDMNVLAERSTPTVSEWLHGVDSEVCTNEMACPRRSELRHR